MASIGRKITLRDVRAIGPGETLWDGAVRGFGARRQKGEGVSYLLKHRTLDGRQRFHTIGLHGSPWTPDMAREEARRLLVEVSKGGDPAADKQDRRKAATVNDLCDQYWADAEAGRLLTRRKVAKKASTLLSDRGRIDRHIRPLLGKLAVRAVTSQDVESFMHGVAAGKTAARQPTGRKRGLSNVRGGQGVATRSMGLLGAIFAYAVRNRLRDDNPVRGVDRFGDGRRDRRLSEAEYGALGLGLAAVAVPKLTAAGLPAKSGAMWPAAVAAARFLALTGWRSGEATALRRCDVDFERRTATLPDSKTGRSVRPLSRAACDVLAVAAKGRAGDMLLFPATRGAGRMTGFPSLFARVAKAGGLPDDVTPHVLRHSFASVAGDLGYSELTIGALIGHRGASITSRYVHAADKPLLAAADTVATRVAELMGEAEPAGAVVPLRAAG